MKLYRSLPALTSALLALAACQDPNAVALKVGAEPTHAAALRSTEIRELAATDDASVLRSATSTIQDLGFTIRESAPAAGVLAGTKNRSAVESGQVAGAVVLALLFGAGAAVWDETQQINVTFVVSPSATADHRNVRVSFDRYITNNRGQLWRTELVADPKIYAQFYEELSKGMAIDSGAKS